MPWKAIAIALLVANIGLAAAPTTQRSDDGRIEVGFPEGWKRVVEENNREYPILAENIGKRRHLAIKGEMKEDLADTTLEMMEERSIEGFHTHFTEIQVGEPKSINIAGNHAIQREVRAAQMGVRYVYICTLIETEKQYITIYCSTVPSRLEESRQDFEQIIASVRDVTSTPLEDLTTSPSQGK